MSSELANILQVPVLTTGTFQGARGPAVEATEETLDSIIRGSNEMRPYLDQALLSGGPIAGNPDALKQIGKPLPAAININHDSLEDDKIRDALLGVDSTFEKIFLPEEKTGEMRPWVAHTFKDVPTVPAEFIRRYFQKRSIELLPLTNPDTGERFDSGAIISTAFLDRATPPAVPGQSPNLLVEFAAAESPLITFTTYQPIMEDTSMDKKDEKTVDVAELQEMKAALTQQQDIIAELKAQVEATKTAQAEAATLATQKETELQNLKAKAEAGETEKYLSLLAAPHPHDGKVYAIAPGFQKHVKPLIETSGLIELEEGKDRKAEMYNFVNGIVEMALAGNIAVCMTEQGYTPPENPDAAPKTKAGRVSELMAADPKLSIYDAAAQADKEGCEDVEEAK